ncbi:hypothetical protein POTOM_014984 [Populus tomentosa]|uniref:Uncharacterized protein n=1 Tax=Populus tomentosa TaxID=118781 RepID=A0A8X8A100_POPTO|nr:hypothetical protein POTOM_014984 [Populus tomentosa]
MSSSSVYYRWKSFEEDGHRPEKPHRFGVTEMRGPQYTLLSQNMLQCGGGCVKFKEIKDNLKCFLNDPSKVTKWDMFRETNRYRCGKWAIRFRTLRSLQDVFETMGQFVDGLKFSGGSHSLMPKSSIKEVIDMAHKHDVYVRTRDWAEHLLRKESLLRYVRLVKSGGLKANPQFAVKFNKPDIPTGGHRAFEGLCTSKHWMLLIEHDKHMMPAE